MDELVFDLLIRGYAKTVPLLHNHAHELPESNTREIIVTRVKQFNHILAEMLLYHLAIPDDPDHLHLLDALDLFPEKLTFEKTRLNMLELIYQVTSNSAIYNQDMTTQRKLQLYATTFYLLSSYFDRERAFIFEIDYKLNSQTYDFEKLYELIELEVSETGSLVLSQTFEIEIIQKISSAIAYADKIKTREPFYLDIFEIILQFILEWLSYFSRDQSDFKEVLLLFSPMINICFYQQIRWYYENKFSKKAFLMNLNLHSFMNYFSNRLDRFEQMSFDRIILHEQKGIAEKYRELIQRWQIHDLLQEDQIKEIIIDARSKFKDSGLTQKQYTGNLIEDALIHGYLDEINRLERFVATDFSSKSSEKLEDLLYEYEIFKFGSKASTYRLERILHKSDTELIPVPLFNNVHRLSIATELFQIQDPGIDSIEERNKRIQEKFARSN